MPATILPYRKTTAGAIVSGDLQTGEIALKDSNATAVFKDGAGDVRIINGFRNVINDTALYTHGTSTETIISSYFIPENTFVGGSVLGIETIRTKDAAVNTMAVKAYINTSNSLSGATQIARFDSTKSIKYAVMKRRFIVNAAGSSMIGYPSGDSSGVDDESATDFSTISYDVTSDIYLIFTEELGNIDFTWDSAAEDGWDAGTWEGAAITDTVTQRLMALTEMR